VAAAGGGQHDGATPALFDARGQHIVHREPLWQRLVLWSLALFMLDLLLRRVRIFDRGFKTGSPPSRVAAALRR
jgi:hypothetical protein